MEKLHVVHIANESASVSRPTMSASLLSQAVISMHKTGLYKLFEFVSRLLRKTKPHIFLTGPLQESAMRELKDRYKVDVYEGRLPISRRKLRLGLMKAEGLICYPFDRIDAEAIDWAPNLRTISTYSVGFDHVNVRLAKERGITVGYTPDVLTDATADIAFALMLDLLRRVTEGDRIIRSGGWRHVYGATDYQGQDLKGKTLGILGMGRIGTAVAKRAAAFGMNLTYHNRHRLSRSQEKRFGVTYVTFEDLISDSNVISIHVPHNEQTYHLFGMKVFRKMKSSSVLINTSRGKVVDEEALIEAIQKKVISGAGLDVFESEPVRKSNPLTKLQNVVLTPHIGSSTVETRSMMAEITIRNLDLGIQGQNPIHSV